MFPIDYILPDYLKISIDSAIEDFSLVISAVNDEFKKQLKLSEFQLEGIQTALINLGLIERSSICCYCWNWFRKDTLFCNSCSYRRTNSY